MHKLTLTFDNGPEPEVTGKVLQTLRRHRLRSSFFVLGQKLEDPVRRALSEQASAEGHWIGNHTYSHSIPLGLRTEPDAPEAEIGRTQELLGELAHPNRWFRQSAAAVSTVDCSALARSITWSATATPACSGIACRATGLSPRAGPPPRAPR